MVRAVSCNNFIGLYMSLKINFKEKRDREKLGKVSLERDLDSKTPPNIKEKVNVIDFK